MMERNSALIFSLRAFDSRRSVVTCGLGMYSFVITIGTRGFFGGSIWFFQQYVQCFLQSPLQTAVSLHCFESSRMNAQVVLAMAGEL